MTAPADPPPPAAHERARFTSRAAVLAVVICAIALSLAYPVREYIGQRRQIDQLEAQRQTIEIQLHRLDALHHKLTSRAYIEQQARDQLHMCLPSQTCYVVIPAKPAAGQNAARAGSPGTPWYERLWHSVRTANQAPAK
jgi:cell division protein FtsB